MTKIVGIRFKSVGKIYYFDPGDYDIPTGTHVIVETARGVEMGTAVIGRREVADQDIIQPLKNVIRLATSADFEQAETNIHKQREAFNTCNQKIKEHKLDMKLVEVEYTFDGNKILFYFTADGRVDFRDLVKDLASVFRTRIELRQIGVRDEAKMLGSYGICGRNLCCSQFLGDFAPVSIKMAKEQGLSLNPTKISGTCGRLMCCLKYEQEAYESLLKITPHQGALVKTPTGKGVVVYVNLLKGKLKVRVEGENEKSLSEFDVSEVKVIKDGRRVEAEKSTGKTTEIIDEEILKTLEDN